MDVDIQIAICGSAGDGTIAAGGILRSAMARGGFRVIAFDDYPPEVRGFGKCVSRTRITIDQSYSLKPQSDILISLDDNHAIPHVKEVRNSGAVIFENKPAANVKESESITAHITPEQFSYGLAIREISERATGNNKSRNIVILGYLAGLFDLPVQAFHDIIADKFKNKPAVVTESNIAAFDAGYKTGKATSKLDNITIGNPKKKATSSTSTIAMMNGNAAIARGCMDAKIDTFFGYPITPATTIMENLAVLMPKEGGRFLQTEDEISAIAAVIGAGYAGSRSATSTSGPGLALMTEMLGLGVMAEVPAVVFVSQRGGPSTGMPTKTEQSDLNLAVYGGAGDAQRIVLAPTSVEGCYECAGRAFEMAEQYQTPVTVLLDLYLSNRQETIELPKENPFNLNANKAPKLSDNTPYKRYELTKDNISPRALPGDKGAMHTITGLEHNELGRPNNEAENHANMSRKRYNKLQNALHHSGITLHKRYGDSGKVAVGLLGWGSTFGECLEAMAQAKAEGISCSAMKVVMLSPLPIDAISAFIADCDQVLVPEVNYEGQFAHLVQGALGCKVNSLTCVSGAPMKIAYILEEIHRLAGNKDQGSGKIKLKGLRTKD